MKKQRITFRFADQGLGTTPAAGTAGSNPFGGSSPMLPLDPDIVPPGTQQVTDPLPPSPAGPIIVISNEKPDFVINKDPSSGYLDIGPRHAPSSDTTDTNDTNDTSDTSDTNDTNDSWTLAGVTMKRLHWYLAAALALAATLAFIKHLAK